MVQLEQAIISTLVYYWLLKRPLTIVELFKFSLPFEPSLKFSDFLRNLKKSEFLASRIDQCRGFYFLKERSCQNLFSLRQKRNKISQLKWRKIKKIAKILQIVPFLKMIGITGSLSLDNPRQESDFDFLIILEPGRLWIGRTIITFILSFLGWRRHDQKTKDRVCLNCYLAGQSLKISSNIKPHDLHSAQEYARLIPVWQAQPGIFKKFQATNSWVGHFLNNWPWPNEVNLWQVESICYLAWLRQGLEYLLCGFLGNQLEKWLGVWQIKRIKRKISQEAGSHPADQIYFSHEYLMFHPQSKSLKLLAKHQAKLKEILEII